MRTVFTDKQGWPLTQRDWNDAIADGDMRRLAKVIARGDYERAKKQIWRREFAEAEKQDNEAHPKGFGFHWFAVNAWTEGNAGPSHPLNKPRHEKASHVRRA